MVEHVPAADPDHEVADALAALESLDRHGRVVRLATEDTRTEPVSRPFWADLLGDAGRAPVTGTTPSLPGCDGTMLDDLGTVAAEADLVVTSLRAESGSEGAGDLVTLAAARMLRVGGILAVLTHSHWPQGELIDPTGAIVAAAQNADLLYLQHIIALHVPVRGGRFATEQLNDTDDPATEEYIRATYRAAVRGLPAPHRRIHSDILAFAQPHEHEPPPTHATEQAQTTGVIR
ncbi:hypothetical protein [Amycolatopsis rhizosphaerae]|uniref:hypothetical protein n=1 Tax=Amycolatopsis rhizosphaerae TaxID=2053003 RepID=UPI001FE76DF8|nr:hypothetical protein [Amycolatopsis rhizosphaerae]